MKFTYDPSNAVTTTMKPFCSLKKPTERHTEEEVTIESPHPNTLEQPISLDYEDDVIGLTDDSKTTTIQQPDSVQYNTSNNEL